jgi:hypothetical protein
MSLLARLIAKEEGFGIPGAKPTRNDNPGDLRHSPHSSHEGEGPNDIGIIPTVAEGWQDLERQLQLYAGRGFTLEQAVYEFAPPSENDSAQYLAYVLKGGGWSNDTLVAEALKIP